MLPVCIKISKMEASKLEGIPTLQEISARNFINRCEDKLGWRDLSSDVIMDVGCGEEGHCGKAILEKFPEVGTIIAIDSNPKVVRNFKLKTGTKIKCQVVDIEKRDSLRCYEGWMTKVVSTHAFHQLWNREEGFRNVHRLLKPGGEAAVLFVIKSLIYEWLTEMLKNPKYKESYKCGYVENMYESGFGKDKCKEMVEKIGFRVIECTEEKMVIPYPSEQECKDALYEMCGNTFNIPPELLEEFKEDCLQVLLKLSEGKPCYRSTELSVLLVKPTEGSGSTP